MDAYTFVFDMGSTADAWARAQQQRQQPERLTPELAKATIETACRQLREAGVKLKWEHEFASDASRVQRWRLLVRMPDGAVKTTEWRRTKVGALWWLAQQVLRS